MIDVGAGRFASAPVLPQRFCRPAQHCMLRRAIRRSGQGREGTPRDL